MLDQGIIETDIHSWYTVFNQEWRQGEHVTLIGGTGTGKTTVAHTILDTRVYVVVLALKRRDDTLDRFRDGYKYGRSSYKIITKWPPDYPFHKVILWIKPKELGDSRGQAIRLYNALNTIYLEGGWCVYFDEAGLITMLGLGQALGVLLNQGRSEGLSIVCGMQRPASIVARVPKEALTAPRHKIIFKYEALSEIKACAEICNIDWREMHAMQKMLAYHGAKRYSDFLVFSHGTITLVRNTGD